MGELKNILDKLGYVNAEYQIEQFAKRRRLFMDKRARQVGLWELLLLVNEFRTEGASKALANNFFTDTQLNEIRKRFRKHELRHRDGVPPDRVPSLLEDLHPPWRHRISSLDTLLKDVSKDVNLEYSRCLQLLRQAHDKVNRERYEKETAAIHNTHFSDAEVKEFRRIFQTFDMTELGELEFETFAEWTSGIVCVDLPLSGLQKSREERLNGDADLDFAEFLLAMRKLLDEDWMKINTSIARAATETAQTEGHGHGQRRLSEQPSTENEVVILALAAYTLHL